MDKEKELNINYDKSYLYKKWKVNIKYNNTYSFQEYLQEAIETTLAQKIDRYKDKIANNI